MISRKKNLHTWARSLPTASSASFFPEKIPIFFWDKDKTKMPRACICCPIYSFWRFNLCVISIEIEPWLTGCCRLYTLSMKVCLTHPSFTLMQERQTLNPVGSCGETRDTTRGSHIPSITWRRGARGVSVRNCHRGLSVCGDDDKLVREYLRRGVADPGSFIPADTSQLIVPSSPSM
jgi:hypothetical protein